MTTSATHEAVERHLLRGLDQIIPRPRVLIRYSTGAACDLRAVWSLSSRLYDLNVEVKTTGAQDAWPDSRPSHKLLERELARNLRELRDTVRGSVEAADPVDHAPELMYARFEVRRGGQYRVVADEEFARIILGRAWAVGGEP